MISRLASSPGTRTIPYERFLILAFMFAALAVVVAIPLYHGLHRSFVANSDMDVESAYQALRILNGEPPLFSPHTAYGYNLLLALWIRAMNFLGMVDTVSLGTIIASPEFDRLFTQIVAVGRILSIVLSIAIVLLVFALTRMLNAGALPAALVAWLTATSPGLMTHTVMLRTELPSMLFILTAACLVLAAGSFGYGESRERRAIWKPFGFLFAAAFAAVYAMMIKVQVALLLPIVLALPFLAVRAENPPLPLPRPAAAALFIGAALLAGPALVSVFRVLDLSRGIPYQAVLPLLTAAAMIVYSRIHALSAAAMTQGLAAAAAGAAVAFHLNYLMNQGWTPYAIVNYVDFMAFEAQKLGDNMQSGHWSPALIVQSLGVAAREFLDTILTQAKRGAWGYLFVAISVTGIVLFAELIRQRQLQILFLAGFLTAAGIVLPILFGLREFFYTYVIYVEPWLFVAFALLVDTAIKSFSRSMQAVGLVLVAAAIALSLHNIQYRLIAPSTGTTRPAWMICCFIVYDPPLAGHFTRHCPLPEDEWRGRCHDWQKILARKDEIQRRLDTPFWR